MFFDWMKLKISDNQLHEFWKKKIFTFAKVLVTDGSSRNRDIKITDIV